MRLPSGRLLNEMDTFFYGYSRVSEGCYRFAGCFECSARELTSGQVKTAVAQVVDTYPGVFTLDLSASRDIPVETKRFDSERALRDFYLACLCEPIEFGNVLLACPGIVEVCVVGLPDLRLGENIGAAVVRASESVDKKTLQRFCLGKLQKSQIPQKVIFVGALPKLSTGKIDRFGVRNWFV